MPHLPSPISPTHKQEKQSRKMSIISDRVYELCSDNRSVSSQLARDSSLSPGEAAKTLYHPDTVSISEGTPPEKRVPATDEELKRAYECGNWGPSKPSELFLRIFHDSLMPLNHDPLMGCCSPSLVGSCGVVPLTVIGPLPDIIRHMVIPRDALAVEVGRGDFLLIGHSQT